MSTIADGVPARCPHNRQVSRDGFGCAVCFRPSLEQAIAAREAGMALAESSAWAAWNAEHIDRAIDYCARIGQPFSSNEIRLLLPILQGTLLGTRFSAASRRREIRQLGWTPATHQAGHARWVRVWVGTGR